MLEQQSQLRNNLQNMYDLRSVLELIDWDHHTYMPIQGSEARGRQMALLEKLIHQRLTDPALLEQIDKWQAKGNLTKEEQGLVRVVRRDIAQANNVPASFLSRFAAHKAKTSQKWVQARAEDDFSLVAPYLEESLQYTREYTSFFSQAKHKADPLIDLNDEGMSVEKVQPLFAELKAKLVPLIEEISQRPQLDSSFLRLHYPREIQMQFIHEVITQLGFDKVRARQDFSPHPFMVGIAHDDVRITTRVDEHNLTDALFSSIHETGHALYELGIERKFEGTPLHSGVSSGIHESQSLFYENIIGRSGPFWECFYPRLQELFSSQLGNVNKEQFVQAINRVEPSLIRVDADEVTYNLHVIIRFELELALLQGDLTINNLPQAWKDAYQRTLGVSVPNDQTGVLQDIHWYSGFVAGEFQGYTLGYLLAAQLAKAYKQDSPDYINEIAQGNFYTLQQWLQNHVHGYGRVYPSDELIQRATGESLQVEPFIEYIEEKYQGIYGI